MSNGYSECVGRSPAVFKHQIKISSETALIAEGYPPGAAVLMRNLPVETMVIFFAKVNISFQGASLSKLLLWKTPVFMNLEFVFSFATIPFLEINGF